MRNGVGDDRADARHDVEVDPDGLERHDDVGEEDRGVGAEAADRLQRDLGDHRGVGAGVEHGGAGSRSARYSGRARPAWRMNHTGVCGTGSRRQARTKAESGGALARVAPGRGSAGGGSARRVVTRPSLPREGRPRRACTGLSDPGGTSAAEEVTPCRRRPAGQVRWCTPCGDEQVFEVPPCEDGHGEDCPDLACVGCGSAVVVGLVLAAVDRGAVLAARAA